MKNQATSFAYCSSCGATIAERQRACPCCLADVIEANRVVIVGQIAPGRRRFGEMPDDKLKAIIY